MSRVIVDGLHMSSKQTIRDELMVTLRSVVDTASAIQTEVKPGVWVPARPMRYQSIVRRIKDAWLVLIDRADALVWPGGQ